VIPQAALARLREAVGAEGLLEHAPLELEGARPELTLAPADGPALGRALGALSELGLAALVRGAGTQLALGNPPRRADLVLSTARLRGIEVLDAEEGVARVRAGTPLSELREAAAACGWEPPLDPLRPEATLGGVLAAGTPGPRGLGFGRPRDAVLGLDTALASGERTRCGGRVVKNVTGYDLAKLYVGSLGTLAVIEAAWLRLRPRPEETRLLVASLASKGVAAGTEAARLPSARIVAVANALLAPRLDPAAPAGHPLALIELAGDASVVAADARELASRLGAASGAPDTLERLREGLSDLPGEAALRARLDVRPSRLAACAAALVGAPLLLQPGLASVHVWLPLGEDPQAAGGPGAADAVARAFDRLAEAARAGGGRFVVEAAPLRAKLGRDVFGEAPEGLALMQALKQRFDPQGVLNPGRFVGGI